jgi:hypothetical protein
MRTADGVLSSRDEVARAAAEAGLTPDGSPEVAYQDADSIAALAAVGDRLSSSLGALRSVEAAETAVEAPRDWFGEIGLAGDPAAELAAARSAWERGDAAAAKADADAVVAEVAAAPAAGRTKVAFVGLGSVMGLALLLMALALVARRRTRRPEPARVDARAAPATAGEPERIVYPTAGPAPERIVYPTGPATTGSGDSVVRAPGDDAPGAAERYPYRMPGTSAADYLDAGRRPDADHADDLDA